MSYTSKVITVEKALSFVKSNSIIVTGLGAAEGGLFMEQLHTLHPPKKPFCSSFAKNCRM